MARLTVEFRPTPNPNAGKFVVNRQVVPTGRSRSFYDSEEARSHPVARHLMELAGIRSIFMVDDFITVTKTAGTTWEALIPEVEGIIRERLPDSLESDAD